MSPLSASAQQQALYKLLAHFGDAAFVMACNSNVGLPTELPEAYQEVDWLFAVGDGAGFAPAVNCFDSLDALVQTQPDYYFGYLTYDLKNELENLSSALPDGLGLPPLYFHRPWLLLRCVAGKIEVLRDEKNWSVQLDGLLRPALPSVSSLPKIPFNRHLSDADYLSTVAHIREEIAAGTVYELNFCMEWSAQAPALDLFNAYRQLNEKTKAPFSVFLKQGEHYLLSGSPERFLRKAGNSLMSQPIKGTQARSTDAVLDAQLKTQLALDEKERAENVMIVDLVRNDLARSCAAGSVEVPSLMQVYSFTTVHQMISTVKGRLNPSTSAVQALANAFPMGSMTGAPKIKAMELIEALERSKRGLYSGAVGYFNPLGDFDFNVVIRSLQYNASTGYLSLMTGSAITYDSVPERELAECKLKAEAILQLFS